MDPVWIIRARKFRQSLSAWTLLAFSVATFSSSSNAEFFGILSGSLTMLYSLRLFPNGQWIQGLIVFSSAGLLMLGFPSSRDQTGPKDPASPGRTPNPTAQLLPEPRKTPVNQQRNDAPAQPASLPIARVQSEEIPSNLGLLVRQYLKAYWETRIEDVLGYCDTTVQFNGEPMLRASLKESLLQSRRSEATKSTPVRFDVSYESISPDCWKVEIIEYFDSDSLRRRELDVLDRGTALKITRDEVVDPQIRKAADDHEISLRPLQQLSGEDTIRSFIVAIRQAEQKRDLVACMKGYAKEAFYFDQKRTWAEIRDDKASYFQKWPSLNEKVTPPIQVDIQRGGYATATFPSRFRVSNSESGRWISGEIQNHYTLLDGPDGWRIIGQKGVVSNVLKSD